jgi:hypothetical protein
MGRGEYKMQYLVEATVGPGVADRSRSTDRARNRNVPGFDAMLMPVADGTIRAGGLPFGDRAFVFMIKAAGNDAADRLIRASQPGPGCGGR